jgi:hypothetical protein
MADFPLDQWFDLTKPISQDDRELCEAQMALYAYKEGYDPAGPEWRRECEKLRITIKQHNAPFDRACKERKQAEAVLRAKAKTRLASLGNPKPKRNVINRMMRRLLAEDAAAKLDGVK